MGGIGSLLGSKGEEGRGKDFFKSVAKGAITGPVGTGILKGVKERRDINKAEKAKVDYSKLGRHLSSEYPIQSLVEFLFASLLSQEILNKDLF